MPNEENITRKKKIQVQNRSKELGELLISYPILPKEKLLYLWSCEKCILCLGRVDAYIDFNVFNHSNKLIRHLDILENKIGPLKIRTLSRMLYMELLNSVRPEPEQTFYLSKYEKKYYNLSFLKKFSLDTDIVYGLKTPAINYNVLKTLELAPKKIIMDNVIKGVSLTKQNR